MSKLDRVPYDPVTLRRADGSPEEPSEFGLPENFDDPRRYRGLTPTGENSVNVGHGL